MSTSRPSAPPSGRPIPVFDAHVDALQRALDLGQDLGGESSLPAGGQFDLGRARRGGVEAVVLVSWVDPSYLEPARGGARRRAQALFGALHELLRLHPGRVRFAGNGRELDQAREQGVIAAIPGIEGGHAIEESLEALECFFAHGLRVLTLVWNNHLSWIRSCQPCADSSIPAGLSDFGRRVVRRMNELGVLVDLSHAGERSFRDALEESSRPVIASHSGCRALHDHPRNLTDPSLRALAAQGGVVGIVFYPGFLDARARADELRVRESEAWRAIAGPNETARALAQAEHIQRAAAPLSIGRVADHVLHAIDVAGIEHVGLGSDFDGIDHRPEGLEDASCYPRLAEELARRGLSESELALVMGGNMRRVYRAATGPGTEAHEARLMPLEPQFPGIR